MSKLTQGEEGSFYTFLSDGCKLCQQGAKMVLFITGLCPKDCFYCPVSEERREDVTYANERVVNSDDEVLEEVRQMNALGTGITGGEPLLRLDKVLHYIRLLKSEFGAKHHIHLYTSMAADAETIASLASAGLDEIRFHPPANNWDELEKSGYVAAIKAAQATNMLTGIEIPSVEGAEKVADFARKMDCFINLNELEFSDSNAERMKELGFRLETEISNAVEGSADIIRKIDGANTRVHFCSSTYKDAVQLRERLIRIAENTAREFDEITDEGTIVYAQILCEDTQAVKDIANYIMEHEIGEEMIEVSGISLETAWWVLEEMADVIRDYAKEMFILERYPFEDGLIVEKIPA
ncbi:radical SAM protein [Methanolobus sp. ZRKC3]|uniref:radical SAM protein n=1 Tax=Methanolobus sp. ZRKC3 TaxID=3125786 RepID=UPI00324964DA